MSPSLTALQGGMGPNRKGDLPTEPEATVRDDPHDAASLIAWFTATEIVRHNGTRSPRDPHMTEAEACLLAAKIGQPSYYCRGDHDWRAGTIWAVALEQCLFMHDRFGWIDREGRFWGCGHAAHELLLHFLGRDIRTVEDGGWIRLSMRGPQTIFEPSDAQIKTLLGMGLEGAAKHLLYEGLKVDPRKARAARVTA
jgi:hypothetical protein